MLHQLFTIAGLGGLAVIAAGRDIYHVIQFSDHDKPSSISLLTKGIPRDLQKLLKYFNGTTISVSNGLLLLAGVLPFIFVLY